MKRNIAAATVALCLSAGVASADTVNWSDDGTFTTASWSEGGVLVTGSADLNFLNLNGIGVVGGFDSVVDSGEWLEFEAEGPVAFSLATFSGGSITNVDGGSIDSFLLEGFDSSGASVGSFDYEGSGLSILFDDFVGRLGQGPVNKFRLTATGDTYRIGGLAFQLAEEPSLVPTPSAALGGLVLMGLAALRRR
jgi:hypothetical protein